jgi:predicted nucleic-acid-binding Zn-ribbon protein
MSLPSPPARGTQVRLEWLRRVQRLAGRCPSCRQAEWITDSLEPVLLLPRAGSPQGHPELEHGMDALSELPVTCRHCGYVAMYSVEHLRNVSPWEE